MYTFKILTAPPGYFTGGEKHDFDSDEEDLYAEYADGVDDSNLIPLHKGGRYPFEEDYENRFGNYQDDNYHGGYEDEYQTYSEEEEKTLGDVFEGMPLYVDSVNIEKPVLDDLIRENFANVFGGLDKSELDSVFALADDISAPQGEEGEERIDIEEF